MNWALFAEAGPAVHIAPAPVLQVGGLTITNSILYGWICMIAMIILLIWIARQMTVHPKGGIVQIVEIGAEFIMNTVRSGFDDKERANKYMSFFVTLFFFLLINNWLGLLPGVGEALTINDVPVLRAFTADLNATLAAATITMIYVYGASIAAFGSPLKYLRHFFVGSPLNPLYLAIGLLEMITNLMRVFSLAIRLFLNVAVGEIVIAVFAYLGHFLAPLTATPFTVIELFVGALQAFIFATLSTMYLATAANHADHERHESSIETTPAKTAADTLQAEGSHA